MILERKCVTNSKNSFLDSSSRWVDRAVYRILSYTWYIHEDLLTPYVRRNYTTINTWHLFLISHYNCLLPSGPHPGMHRQQASRLCSNIRFTKRCSRQVLWWRHLKKEEATSEAGERKEENEGNGQGQRSSRGFHGSHSDQRLVHRTTYAIQSRMSHPSPPLLTDLLWSALLFSTIFSPCTSYPTKMPPNVYIYNQ